MAAVKVDLPLINSIKSGSTTVNRVMWGENKIWPMFPIVLKIDDTFYNVSGIQNNEYVKTEIPNEVCTLVQTKGKWISDVDLVDYMHVEIWFTQMASYGGKFVGDEPANGDGRCFRFINLDQPGSNDEIYLDYMSKNSSGTSLNRISKRVNKGTNYNSNMDFRSTQTEVTYHAKCGCKYDTKWKTFFEISGDDGYYLYQESTSTIYGADGKRTGNPKFGIFGYISDATKNRALTFYKILIYDKDDNILGNWRWKKVNNEWILYDFDKPMTKIDSNGETAYENKTMSFAPNISEYYEISGTITSGSDTYEKLVNNKTGFIIKGIKIEE